MEPTICFTDCGLLSSYITLLQNKNVDNDKNMEDFVQLKVSWKSSVFREKEIEMLFSTQK